MIRYALILGTVACTAGCRLAYRVHVNTFSELATPLSPTASIYVVADSNSPNPILARQIESKITELLRGRGYKPVETADAADYLLTTQIGMDSEKFLDYSPVFRPFGGFYYGGHFHGWELGYTTYVPYVDTVYRHWLRMKLLAGHTRATQENLVWLGEATTGTGDPELREAVNYLLVGCVEYLGVDTREWITMKIRRDDPRILSIAGEGTIQ